MFYTEIICICVHALKQYMYICAVGEEGLFECIYVHNFQCDSCICLQQKHDIQDFKRDRLTLLFYKAGNTWFAGHDEKINK